MTSPMPTTAEAAVEQQTRWESGNAQLTGAYLMRLLAGGVGTRDVQLLAAGGELLVPSQSMVAAGSLAVGAVAAVARRRRIVALAAATLAGQAIYVVGGLAAAEAPAASLRALAYAPAFVVGRMRVLGRVATGRRAQTWVRTTRGLDRGARWRARRARRGSLSAAALNLRGNVGRARTPAWTRRRRRQAARRVTGVEHAGVLATVAPVDEPQVLVDDVRL